MPTYSTNFVAGGNTGSPLFNFLTGPSNLTWTNATEDGTLDVGEVWQVAADPYEYLGYIVVAGETLLRFQPVGGSEFGYFGQVSDPAAFETLIEGNPSLLDAATLITTPLAVCFAAGTLIATPTGERAVEALAIGDLVTTADGRAVPVRWVGRQTLHKLFAGERACPVHVAAGALGGGLPHAELVLTADHALILDGLAVNAGALVNGTTITRAALADLPERVTYYHIETADHDVILANGAAAETFVDYIGRRAFDNHAEYVALYGDDRVIAEMPLPRISSRRQLPADLRARFGIASFGDDVTAEAAAFLAARQVA